MSREDLRKRYNTKKAELGSAWEGYLQAVQEAKEAQDLVFAGRERLFQKVQAGEGVPLEDLLLDASLDDLRARRREAEAGERFDQISRELAELGKQCGL